MKKYSAANLKVLMMALAAVNLIACADHRTGIPPHGEIGVAVAPQSIAGNTLARAGTTAPVSGGPNLLGVSVPTNGAIAARIQNGLQGAVSPTTGNFARALNQVRTNLPKVSDIGKASGFDQIQLLAYAACSDMTTGTTPLMKTRYNIDPKTAVSANQTALIEAGLNILDAHLAGLASQGTASTQVTSILTNLVQAQAAGGNTTTIAFMTVCMAANTAATAMLGI